MNAGAWTIGAAVAALYLTMFGCGAGDGYGADAAPPGDGDGGRGNGGQIGNPGGTGGKGGGGTGGGAVGNPDSCPGARTTLQLGAPVTLHGTTIGFRDDITPYCAAPEDTGADAVYALLPGASGTLTVTVSPTTPGMRPILYLQRAHCGAVASAIACEEAHDVSLPASDGGLPEAGNPHIVDAASSGGLPAASSDASLPGVAGGNGDAAPPPPGRPDAGPVDAAVAVAPDVPLPIQTRVAVEVRGTDAVYVVVDSSGGPGNFVLDAALTAPACGDGVVNAATDEQCDYGPSPPKGCSATCRFEAADADDQCAIDAAALSVTPLRISGRTIGYKDDYTPPCSGVGIGGPDAVRGVLSDTPGIVTASVTADYDVVLYASDSCVKKALGGALACSDGDRKNASETISFPVAASTPSFVVVDGVDAQAYGTYSLVITFNPAP